MGLFGDIAGIAGIADALSGGIKTVELKVTKAKDIKQLYELIKDKEFKIGAPFLGKVAGAGTVIAFPALDKNNQVQIWFRRKKFMICRSETPAGTGKFLGSMALDSLSDGLTGLSGTFGSTKEMCNKLVEEMGAELNAMNL